MQLRNQLATPLTVVYLIYGLLFGTDAREPNINVQDILAHEHDTFNERPPTKGPPTDNTFFDDIKRDEKQRQLDSLGGANIYNYRSPPGTSKRDFGDFQVDNDAFEATDDFGDDTSIMSKRALDTLGGMQIHGYKREFDSLGGANLHGGYGYKRAFDTLGGAFVHPYKRFLSTLGGANVHRGYKREDMEKRYLSSLGGANIMNYKRAFDSLGGANIHGGYNKRILSSLGGANIHNGGYKRTLSALGGTNIHGYKRSDEDDGEDFEKRALDTLGGYGLHRFKRNDNLEQIKTEQ